MKKSVYVYISLTIAFLIVAGAIIWALLTRTIHYTIVVHPDTEFNQYTISVEKDHPLMLDEPTKEGYTFAGWYADSEYTEILSNGGALHVVTSNLDVYAKWDPISYSIYYVIGSNVINPNTIDSFNIDSEVIHLENATSTTGSIFLGWYKGYDVANNVMGSLVTTIYPATTQEDLILYAVFESNLAHYSVIHYIENLDSTYSVYQVDELAGLVGYEASATLLDIEHYEVASYNSEILASNTVIRVYYSLERHIVRFYDHESYLLREVSVPYGGEAYAPELPNLVGYDLVGWSLDFSVVTSDLAVFAIYTPRNDTPYIVRAWVELEDGTFVLYAELTLQGTTGEWVFPPYEDMVGYSEDERMSTYQILADGSLVIDMYYYLED